MRIGRGDGEELQLNVRLCGELQKTGDAAKFTVDKFTRTPRGDMCTTGG